MCNEYSLYLCIYIFLIYLRCFFFKVALKDNFKDYLSDYIMRLYIRLYNEFQNFPYQKLKIIKFNLSIYFICEHASEKHDNLQKEKKKRIFLAL